MPADLYDTKEPLLRCLQDSLAAWQSALNRILAQSGVSPDEWQLLMQLAEPDTAPSGAAFGMVLAEPSHPYGMGDGGRPAGHGGPQRHIDTVLLALSEQGWLEPGTNGEGRALPAIRSTARRRLDKLRQAVRALQSAWVAPLSLEERGQMMAYLTRMQGQLDRYAPHTCQMAGNRLTDKPMAGTPFADIAPAQDDGSRGHYRCRRSGVNGI